MDPTHNNQNGPEGSKREGGPVKIITPVTELEQFII